MKYCMIEVAFGSLDEAKLTINKLLDLRLAASCQLLENNNYWNWKNEKEESKEYLVLIKTKLSLQEKIYNIIKSIHSYECFEFAVFEFNSINNDYLKWIEDETLSN